MKSRVALFTSFVLAAFAYSVVAQGPAPGAKKKEPKTTNAADPFGVPPTATPLADPFLTGPPPTAPQNPFGGDDSSGSMFDGIKNGTVKVYVLKSIRVSDAAQALRNFVDFNARIAEDARRNALIVYGNEEAHNNCNELLKKLESQLNEQSGNQSILYSASAEIIERNRGIIQTFAENEEVSVGFDLNNGAIILRGLVSDVEKVRDLIKDLESERFNKKAEATKVKKPSYLLQFLWLTDAQTINAIAIPDPKLLQIFDRLETLGIKDLRVGMQLLAKCDQMTGNVGQCDIEGSVELVGSILQAIHVIGEFESQPEGGGFAAKLKIDGTRGTSGMPLTAQNAFFSNLSIVLNLLPEKYYVLASAPQGSHQSVFVVRLIEDF